MRAHILIMHHYTYINRAGSAGLLFVRITVYWLTEHGAWPIAMVSYPFCEYISVARHVSLVLASLVKTAE